MGFAGILSLWNEITTKITLWDGSEVWTDSAPSCKLGVTDFFKELSASSKPTTKLAQPRLSRSKWHRSNTPKFVASRRGNDSHIGTHTHTHTHTRPTLYPLAGMTALLPAQTGLCKFGWVWSSLKLCEFATLQNNFDYPVVSNVIWSESFSEDHILCEERCLIWKNWGSGFVTALAIKRRKKKENQNIGENCQLGKQKVEKGTCLTFGQFSPMFWFSRSVFSVDGQDSCTFAAWNVATAPPRARGALRTTPQCGPKLQK